MRMAIKLLVQYDNDNEDASTPVRATRAVPSAVSAEEESSQDAADQASEGEIRQD